MLAEPFRKPLTVGHALILLFAIGVLTLVGTSIAAIPGPDGTIKACVKKRAPNKGAVRVIDHNKRCLSSEKTLSWNQKGGSGPAGVQGQPGAQGERGPQGEQGVQGAGSAPGSNGLPDTGLEILGKLAPVDGTGSGLDADSLDGRPSADFLPSRLSNFAAEPAAVALSWSYYDFDTNPATEAEFDVGSGFIHIQRTGTAGEFQVCARNNTAVGYNVPYVVRVADNPASAASLTNATGTAETCSGVFLVPDGREFTVHVQGALIVGTPRGNFAGTAALSNRWRLIGLGF